MKTYHFFIFLCLLSCSSEHEEQNPFYEQGLKDIQQKNYEEAIDLFNHAIEEDPLLADAFYQKALAYYYLEKYLDASETLRRCFLLDPHHAMADELKRNIYAEDYNEPNYFEEFSKKNESLGDSLDISGSYLRRGKQIADAYRDYEEGIKYYKKALEYNSHSAEVYFKLAQATHELGKYGEAVILFDKAVALNPESKDFYFYRGISNQMIGKLQEAIGDYTHAIRIDSGMTVAWNNRGFTYNLKGDYSSALLDLNHRLEIGENAYAYNNRAFAFYKKGKLDSALKDCNKSLQLDANNGQAYYHRALIEYDLKLFESACEDYKKAFELKIEEIEPDKRLTNLCNSK